jgi:hypothetical protein
MRFGLMLIVLCTCSGCGILTGADEDQKVAMATAAVVQAVSKCNAKHAAGFAKTAVARTDCINDALLSIRAVYPYPDLLDRYMAGRHAIAEKYGTGRITLATANEEFIAERSKMIDEEQKRLPDGKSEPIKGSNKLRHITLFDSILKTPPFCGPNSTSVNCF